ncbi:hypothetical protein M011DRAFT_479710 [Sporormia fimetaria CBS 119925]|uniref:SacI domain-containing protein n=1 Tax=Sporormia fimetaria CBS 119925 TaxID=1340428 RepID=A0A6A6V2H9_9PLEO|nr:hypothetical protein M011DRAFT_479710 [Sporormia fimetaria CBS 119925]
MPGLVRKLLIFAAVDGLVLQPAPPRNHAPSTQQAIKVDYKGNVRPLLKDRRDEDTAPVSLEIHGIIGLLKVATSFFLIAISEREQVAEIRGKVIYKVTDVALIPLSSQDDAHSAITSAREHARRHKKPTSSTEDDTETETEDDDTLSATDSLLDAETSHDQSKDLATGQAATADRRTSVAQDVIRNKGVYGRFADKWFSRKGWSTDSRRTIGLSSEEDLAATNKPSNVQSTLPEDGPNTESKGDGGSIPASDDRVPEDVSPAEIPKALEGRKDSTTIALLPKILRTTKLYFGSGNFFFSYDYDLSHSVGQPQPQSSLPLHSQYDPLFFWNRHIISPFMDAGQHNFVMPVIQGFVGQRSFSIKPVKSGSNSAVIDPSSTSDDIPLQSWKNKDEEDTSAQDRPAADQSPDSNEEQDFLLTVISRRSVKRAGLRYLRRGVDEEGNAANSVETEQILSCLGGDGSADKVFSFLQYRASIPLFFSQSPYSLKPQVDTWGTTDTNAKAFRRHFSDLSNRYGHLYCASLVDKHGTEAKIGELYEQHAKSLNENGGLDGNGKELGFEWFDFHNVCRGMKFEKVSVLMETLGPFLKSTSWTEIADGQVVKQQSGILRTNCMDCLDRTNVVQSACARTALEAQLSEGGFSIDLQNDPSTSWFNTLWADNGDAISRQYAGTAALKGDFTRTRKRQITGALTDFGLTLTRYYNNIVNDYFTQAVIDYMLGRAPDTIFAEFEADMKSSDYFIDVRKVREAAIERSAGIVIEDKNEDLIAGWTLSVPTSANKLKTTTFEEAVLLLTQRALYFCRLDWGTEKVKEFEQIELDHIERLARGVYITSTLAERHTDAEKNVGFVIRYRAHMGDLVRRNTRSLDSKKRDDPPQKGAKSQQDDGGRFLAFKALPPQSSVTSSDGHQTPESEQEIVRNICDQIAKVTNEFRRESASTARNQSGEEEGGMRVHELAVEEKDIISLADAKKSTGYLEQIGYSLKKMVWA